MKKNAIRSWVILGIVLVAYNLLAFLPPSHREGAFWVSYAFTMVSILAQAYVFYIAFRPGTSVKSKIYGFPIARVGVIYLIVQLVVGFVFMLLGEVAPLWIGLIIQILVLAAAALGVILTDITRDAVESRENVTAAEVSFIRTMHVKVTGMAARCENGEARAAIQKLADALRYSDPVSGPALVEADRNVAFCVDGMQNALVGGDYATVKNLCRRAEIALEERNALCRLNKR